MAQFVKVAKTSDLPDNSGMAVDAGSKTIALFKINGEYYAIGDSCTHQQGPLSEGDINVEERQVTCPWHGAVFDCLTGEALEMPATEDVSNYRVRVSGDDIEIEL